MTSTASTLSKALGITRILYGAGLLTAPRRVGGHWLGPNGADPAAQPPQRSLGVRDGLIGWATLRAAGNPRICAQVVALGAVGDTVDCIGTIAAHRADPRVRLFYAGAAAAAAIASLALAAQLRREGESRFQPTDPTS